MKDFYDKRQGFSLKSENPRIILFKTFKYLWPRQFSLRCRVISSIFCVFLAKISTILIPLFLMASVDFLNSDNINKNEEIIFVWGIFGLILGYGAVRFLSIAFAQIRDILFVNIAQRGLKKLGLDSFTHLHELPLDFHLSRQTGSLNRIIERGVKGVEFLLRFLVFSIGPLFLELLFVCILIIYKFEINYLAIILITIFAYAVFTFKITSWRIKIRRKMNAFDTDLSQKAVDSLLNYETVKYFSAEQKEVEKYNHSLSGYEKYAIKSGRSLSFLNIGQAMIVTCGLTALMLIASSGVINGSLTVGGFVGLNVFMLQLIFPLNFLGTVYREIRQSLVDMGDLFNLLNIPKEEIKLDKKTSKILFKDQIEFNDVSFSYDNKRNVLEKFSCKIDCGHTTAIVGPSGSGKSTIGKLIFGFYQPTFGNIFVDGCNINEFQKSSIRRMIGVVPQDIVLFNETLRYNILYGIKSCSNKKLKEVISQGDLSGFISNLPDGLSTVVGERGLKLSGGEKQRVGLARVFLKPCSLYILDEATSSLDSRSEKKIVDTFFKKRETKTLIIITHRLSSIVKADKIIVVKDGRIEQIGTHQHLVHSGGLYQQMWEKQDKLKNSYKR